MRISTKILLSVLVVSFLMSIGTNFYYFEKERMEATERLKKDALFINTLLARVNTIPMYDLDIDEMRENINAFLKHPDMIGIQVQEYLGNEHDEGSMFLDLSDNPSPEASGKILKSVDHIYMDGLKIGSIHTSFSTRRIEKHIDELKTNFWRISFLQIFILSVLIYLIVERITAPVQKLTRMSLRVRDGDFSDERQADDFSNDELGILAESFFKMRDSIKHKMEELSVLNEELETSKLRLMNHVQNTPLAVIDFNKDMQVISWNTSAIHIFGYSEEEALNLRYENLLYESDHQEAKGDTLIAFGDAEPGGILIVESRSKYNGKMICEWYNTVIRNQNGEVSGVSSLVLDVTDRYKTEEKIKRINEELERKVKDRTRALEQSLDALTSTQKKLVEAEKMASLGMLVAGVAHEVNTPIGVAMTASSFLDRQSESMLEHMEHGRIRRTDFEKYVKNAIESSKCISTNITRAALIIQNFKSISIDQTVDKRKTFKMRQVIENVLINFKEVLNQTQLSVDVKCSESLEMYSYFGVFSQIFNHLLNNSLKHAYELNQKGQITFEILETPKDLFIKYSDDGKGMDREIKEQVFEPFYTTRRGEGCMGLGLHIVYNLVLHKLKGEIECSSTPENGSIFLITIPLEN